MQFEEFDNKAKEAADHHHPAYDEQAWTKMQKLLDALESRGLCARMRSTNDRRSHILVLTDKGRAVLARAKKLVASKHEARLNELLGPANRVALLEMLSKIAAEF